MNVFKILKEARDKTNTKVIPDTAVMIVNFPSVRQSTKYSCGAAAAQSILGYYGIDKREDELMKELGTDKDGTDIAPLVDLFKRNKLRTDDMVNLSVDDIKKYIKRKVPVIMSIQAWGKKHAKYRGSLKDGHYVVAIGYDKDGIIFQDPSILGARGFIPYGDLDDRWNAEDDDKTKISKHGIAVHGTPKLGLNKKQLIEVYYGVSPKEEIYDNGLNKPNFDFNSFAISLFIGHFFKANL